ncbi:acireductone synthase [Coralloluteibacterium stylophorae]|uniref:Enolase-phosphatase E1 n=1 Tax=Coralloluteibacterium stylophorae TaxID=1776034 RepID=A0A8J7VS74_9GAMM|nr:acireductone synthase [Coralloluteibacterium stylophorae]MBS7455878.1 acireductone synthase [Coralloluteibacterium stylophorae]
MTTATGKRSILVDVEGTIGSISFVRDTLFPYARQALPAFVRARGGEPEVRALLDSVAAEIGTTSDGTIIETLQGWIDADSKHTALKALQGLIWRDGYASGAYVAHLYDDAVAKLREWHDAGHPIHVYSSGSVEAQRQFFAHTAAGDLTGIVSGHFDTGVGAKREVASYRAILAELGVHGEAVTFVSDVVEELDAAREAGMATVLVDRREDYPEPREGTATHGHARVESFIEIDPNVVEPDPA